MAYQVKGMTMKLLKSGWTLFVLAALAGMAGCGSKTDKAATGTAAPVGYTDAEQQDLKAQFNKEAASEVNESNAEQKMKDLQAEIEKDQ